MARRFLVASIAFGAVLSLAAAQTGVASEPLSAQVRQQFTTFCRAIDASADEPSDLKRAPTWIRAASDQWVFSIDLVGNRSLCPVGSKVRATATMPYAAGRLQERLWVLPAVQSKLIDETRRLAAALAQVRSTDGSAHLKQEVVLICWRDKGIIQRYPGRYLVRLNDLPGRKYFQVIYGPDQKPLRIDTNVRDPACRRLADAIANLMQDANISAHQQAREPLALGTFFDPDQGRFELNACSHEGVDFLNLAQRQNPFGRDRVALSSVPPPQTAAYRASQEYRHWCWAWWTGYGRVGAIRGNWDPLAREWEHPAVKVQLHRCLANYPLKNGQPREKRKYPMPDGKEHEFPFAGAEEFAPSFYEDLERCHVVYISTHGGHVGRRFRFRRNIDIWVKLEPPAGHALGEGNLRHFFFEGCGSMTFLAEPAKAVLLDTWIHSGLVSGMRTACGHDGGHTGYDRSGWRFYGRYNKGDAICDAWSLGNIDENVANNPVTIAYGQSRQEAIDTLLTGRFTTQRAGANWVAVSLWGNPGDSPR